MRAVKSEELPPCQIPLKIENLDANQVHAKLEGDFIEAPITKDPFEV